MNKVEELIVNRAKELLSCKEVDKVIGWKKGEFYFDPSPAVFTSEEELKDFVYNGFCGANLSKYLVQELKKGGKIAVFLKPCDTYSFNELVKEHRVDKNAVKVIAIECQGKLDIEKIKEKGVSAVTETEENGEEVVVSSLYGTDKFRKEEVLLEKCLTCKSKKFAVADETIVVNEMKETANDRFSGVEKLEQMSEEERFAFWKGELSKCIRCNACRNVCPACTCVKCVFDNNASGMATKAPADTFEEQMFHIIRAYHVAGRCTDCGECSRVCPQHIPLHLLNRKFIKDINKLYGDFQAGEADEGKNPLIEYTEKDAEPTEAVNGEVRHA